MLENKDTNELKALIISDLKRQKRKISIIVLASIFAIAAFIFIFFSHPRVIYRTDGEEAYVAGIIHGMNSVEIKETYRGKPVTRIESMSRQNYYEFSEFFQRIDIANEYNLKDILINSNVQEIQGPIGDRTINNETQGVTVYSELNSKPSDWDIDNQVIWGFEKTVVDDSIVYALSNDGNAFVIRESVDSEETNLIIQENVHEHEVTGIVQAAFRRNGRLENITIPNNVTDIGDSAFEGAENLKEVTFEKNSNITSIEQAVFKNANSLERFKIPKRVKTINANAFQDTDSLETVIFEEESKLETIGSSAFQNADGLIDIKIPSSVINIDAAAFNSASNLTTVTFEEDSQLETIRRSAFENAESLTSIVIPDGVKKVEEAFRNASSLTIYKERSEEDVDWYSHKSSDESGIRDYGTYNDLDYVVLSDDTVTILGQTATSEAISIDIPETFEGFDVTAIGARAFKSNGELEDIHIPRSITTIDEAAFKGASITTIYVEAENKPGGWDDDWNPDDVTVKWGYEKE